MLKTTKKVISSEIDIIDAIVCNKCGKEAEICGYLGEDQKLFAEMVAIDKFWGYFSKKDMIHQKAHICESCWDSFCSSFLVPVTESSPD